MIRETHFETIKNSLGESSEIRHYIMDSDMDFNNLPTDAPVGSDLFQRPRFI